MNEIGSVFPPAPAFESKETANIRVTNPSKSTKLTVLPVFFCTFLKTNLRTCRIRRIGRIGRNHLHPSLFFL
jgi:hypothetical protein